MRLMSIIQEGPDWENTTEVPDFPSSDDKQGPFTQEPPELPASNKGEIKTLEDLHNNFSQQEWFRIAYILVKGSLTDPGVITNEANRWLKYLGPGGKNYSPSGFATYSNQITNSKVPVTNFADIAKYFREVLDQNKDLEVGAGTGEKTTDELSAERLAGLAKRLQDALGGVVDDEAEVYNIIKSVGNQKNWTELKKQFEKTAKIPLVTRLNDRLDFTERKNVSKILKDMGITEPDLIVSEEGKLDAGSLVPNVDADFVFTKYDSSSDPDNARDYLIKLFRAYRKQGSQEAKIDDWLSQTKSLDDNDPLPQEVWRKEMKDKIETKAKTNNGITKREIDLEFEVLINLAKRQMKLQ